MSWGCGCRPEPAGRSNSDICPPASPRPGWNAAGPPPNARCRPADGGCRAGPCRSAGAGGGAAARARRRRAPAGLGGGAQQQRRAIRVGRRCTWVSQTCTWPVCNCKLPVICRVHLRPEATLRGPCCRRPWAAGRAARRPAAGGGGPPGSAGGAAQAARGHCSGVGWVQLGAGCRDGGGSRQPRSSERRLCLVAPRLPAAPPSVTSLLVASLPSAQQCTWGWSRPYTVPAAARHLLRCAAPLYKRSIPTHPPHLLPPLCPQCTGGPTGATKCLLSSAALRGRWWTKVGHVHAVLRF